MTRLESSPLFRWYLVALLAAIACLNYADRSALSSVLSLIRDDLHMSPVMLGAVGSAFLWVYAICSPASGYLADRLPRTRVIVWSLIAWSVVTILTGFTQNPVQILLARSFLGLAQCAYVPAAVALTAEYHQGTTRARAIGIQLAGYNVGVVLGGGFSGYAGDHWGWRPAFWTLGLAGILLAIVAHAILPKHRRQSQRERLPAIKPLEALRSLFAVPTFTIVLLESTCIAAGAWIFLVWLPLYFKESFGLSLTAAGLAGTVGLQAAATTASLASGFLSDRFAGVRREKRMLFQFLCFVCAIPFLTAFMRNPSLTVASVAILFFAFFRSLGSSNDNVIVCDVLPSRVWSTAVGVSNSANCLAGGIGVLLTGYLKDDFGLEAVFGGLYVSVTVAAVLVLAGYRYYLKADLARAAVRPAEKIATAT